MAAAGAVTALVALGGAAPASAAAATTVRLAPGQSAWVSQYASFPVRAEGQATRAGARFRLLRNGEVIDPTPGRVNCRVADRHSAHVNLPGPGYFSACAFNTGTTNTNVYLDIRTDFEIKLRSGAGRAPTVRRGSPAAGNDKTTTNANGGDMGCPRNDNDTERGPLPRRDRTKPHRRGSKRLYAAR